MGEKETAAGFAESDESNNADDATDAQRSNYLKHLDRAAGGGGKGEPEVTPDVAATIIKSKSNITNN